MSKETPILMTEESWMNTHLSVARYYGGVTYNGKPYIIVDKKGRDLFECSAIAEKEGRQKAIEPGEPADLIQKTFQPIYKELGRDKFIATLEAHPEIREPKQMKDILEDEQEATPPRNG